MSPAKPAKKTPLSRGHVTIDPDGCITCPVLPAQCPLRPSAWRCKEKTWQIDRLRCVVCDCCVEVCPTKCLTMDTPVLTGDDHSSRVVPGYGAGPKKKERHRRRMGLQWMERSRKKD